MNMQALGNGGDEFQRMKLRLFWVPHRAGRGEGERQVFGKLRRGPQLFQRRGFPLDFAAVVPRIDVSVLFFKAAFNIPAEFPVPAQRRFVGLPVQPRLFGAEFPDQLVVEQPVLGGDFGGGVFGDSAAHRFRFRKKVGDAVLMQHVCAQNARHSAADNQHVGFGVLPQRCKTGARGCALP